MDLEEVARTRRADRDARKAAGRPVFNVDKTRYIQRELLGWACYAGAVDAAGYFHGTRAGVCAEEATADSWLDGGRVYFDQKADEGGTLRVGGGWSDHDPLWEAAKLHEDDERLAYIPQPGFVCNGTHKGEACGEGCYIVAARLRHLKQRVLPRWLRAARRKRRRGIMKARRRRVTARRNYVRTRACR
jgi:hypothetical protein